MHTAASPSASAFGDRFNPRWRSLSAVSRSLINPRTTRNIYLHPPRRLIRLSVHKYMYNRLYMRTLYICIQTMHARIHTCVNACIHTCMHNYTCILINIQSYTHIYIHSCVNIHISIHSLIRSLAHPSSTHPSSHQAS